MLARHTLDLTSLVLPLLLPPGMRLAVSVVERASLQPVPDSPRVFVTVYFNGPLPPILGYWSMN